MFSSASRYAAIATTTRTVPTPDGAERTIAYVRRRILPRPADHMVLTEHTVAPGERLDHLAARYLADPEQFWRICDGAGVLDPAELEEVGRRVPITMPLPSPAAKDG